jgi:hypothetical protein
MLNNTQRGAGPLSQSFGHNRQRRIFQRSRHAYRVEMYRLPAAYVSVRKLDVVDCGMLPRVRYHG